MGKMKEIYEMVQDGTSDIFIDAYKHARINNALGFTYNYRFYDIIKAKAIVELIKQAQKDYDNHLVDQIESYYEWQAEIARGK
jgi:hypothetical protein|tara:strand:- start:68 stop:316 length:249 start_codon:yes stop_codon:yes gene_type:complete